MPRLFVAVDFPDETIAKICSIPLPDRSNARVVKPDQMHLTLHFLGEADVDETVNVLQGVVLPKFTVTVAATGHFSTGDRSVILWAGMWESPELKILHSAIGAALKTIGFQPESRPFAPHITLARYKQGLSQKAIRSFVEQNQNLVLSEIPITAFALYSSTLGKGGPVYHCERQFLLLD